jgi:hypothetical protein
MTRGPKGEERAADFREVQALPATAPSNAVKLVGAVDGAPPYSAADLLPALLVPTLREYRGRSRPR